MWPARTTPGEDFPILAGLLCPLCHNILRDPVSTVDGCSYCRQCINGVFLNHDIIHAGAGDAPPLIAPVTKMPLVSRALLPNAALADAVQSFSEARSRFEQQSRELSQLRMRNLELESELALCGKMDVDPMANPGLAKVMRVTEIERLKSKLQEKELEGRQATSEILRLRSELERLRGRRPSSAGPQPERGKEARSDALQRELRELHANNAELRRALKGRCSAGRNHFLGADNPQGGSNRVAAPPGRGGTGGVRGSTLPAPADRAGGSARTAELESRVAGLEAVCEHKDAEVLRLTSCMELKDQGLRHADAEMARLVSESHALVAEKSRLKMTLEERDGQLNTLSLGKTGISAELFQLHSWLSGVALDIEGPRPGHLSPQCSNPQHCMAVIEAFVRRCLGGGAGAFPSPTQEGLLQLQQAPPQALQHSPRQRSPRSPEAVHMGELEQMQGDLLKLQHSLHQRSYQASQDFQEMPLQGDAAANPLRMQAMAISSDMLQLEGHLLDQQLQASQAATINAQWEQEQHQARLGSPLRIEAERLRVDLHEALSREEQLRAELGRARFDADAMGPHLGFAAADVALQPGQLDLQLQRDLDESQAITQRLQAQGRQLGMSPGMFGGSAATSPSIRGFAEESGDPTVKILSDNLSRANKDLADAYKTMAALRAQLKEAQGSGDLDSPVQPGTELHDAYETIRELKVENDALRKQAPGGGATVSPGAELHDAYETLRELKAENDALRKQVPVGAKPVAADAIDDVKDDVIRVLNAENHALLQKVQALDHTAGNALDSGEAEARIRQLEAENRRLRKEALETSDTPRSPVSPSSPDQTRELQDAYDIIRYLQGQNKALQDAAQLQEASPRRGDDDANRELEQLRRQVAELSEAAGGQQGGDGEEATGKDLASAQARITELEDQIDEMMKADDERYSLQPTTSLETELQDAYGVIQDLKEEVSALQMATSIGRTKSDLAREQRVQDELEQARQELVNARQEVELSSKELHGLQDELSSARDTIDDLQAKAAEEKRKLEDQIAALQAENKRLENQSQGKPAAGGIVDRHQGKPAAGGIADRQRARPRIKTREEGEEEVQAIKQDIDDLEDRIRAVTAWSEEADLGDPENSPDLNKEEMERLNQQVQDLKDKLKKAEDRRKQDKAELTRAIGSMVAHEGELEKVLDDLERGLARAKGQVAEKDKQLQQLAARTVATDEELEDLLRENDKLREKLRNAQVHPPLKQDTRTPHFEASGIADIMKQLDEEEAQDTGVPVGQVSPIDQATHLVNDEELEDLLSINDKLIKERDELQGQLDNVYKGLSRTKSSLHQNRLQDLQDLNHQLLEELEQLKTPMSPEETAIVADVERKLREAERHLAALTEEYDHMEDQRLEENMELKETVRQLRTENESLKAQERHTRQKDATQEDELRQELRQVKAENEALKAQERRNRHKDLTREVARLRGELQTTEAELKEQNRLVDALRSQLRGKHAMDLSEKGNDRGDEERLRQRIEDLERVNAEKDRALADGHRQFETWQSKTKEWRQKIEDRHAALTAEIADKDEELQKANRELEDLRKQVGQANDASIQQGVAGDRALAKLRKSLQAMLLPGALVRAAQESNLQQVKALLDARANVAELDDDGQTPLHVASFLGKEAIARELLNAGASANVKDHYGETPLHEAARGGRDATTALLLEAKARADVQDRAGVSPLHKAAYSGNANVVRTLCNAKADINVKDSQGWTPLYYTAMSGNSEVARTLLQCGADPGVLPKNAPKRLEDVARDRGNKAVAAAISEFRQSGPR